MSWMNQLTTYKLGYYKQINMLWPAYIKKSLQKRYIYRGINLASVGLYYQRCSFQGQDNNGDDPGV